MKGYTNFADGFLGMGAIATKPIGNMKYMDWEKVQKIVDEHPDSVIYAGLMEDWNNTSGLIYAKGKYYNGYVYGCSKWATPIVDVDGEEIECWTNEETEEDSGKPTWWGNGQKLLSEWDYEDEDEDEDEDSEDISEVLEEIIDRIEKEVLNTLSDGGDDWFTASKVNEVVDIIKEYMSN